MDLRSVGVGRGRRRLANMKLRGEARVLEALLHGHGGGHLRECALHRRARSVPHLRHASGGVAHVQAVLDSASRIWTDRLRSEGGHRPLLWERFRNLEDGRAQSEGALLHAHGAHERRRSTIAAILDGPVGRRAGIAAPRAIYRSTTGSPADPETSIRSTTVRAGGGGSAASAIPWAHDDAGEDFLLPTYFVPICVAESSSACCPTRVTLPTA